LAASKKQACACTGRRAKSLSRLYRVDSASRRSIVCAKIRTRRVNGRREPIVKPDTWENSMPKRRDVVKMSEDEIWTFIESQRTIQVATINKDGTPHVMPLWFAIEDGQIVLETFTKSQKIVNLERDHRISILFEDGESYNDLKGVSIKGRAELVRQHDEVHRLHMAVLVRNQPEVPVELLEKATASMVAKKTAILIQPERFITWDHSKLAGIY
jgi:PPOX class probable F420-dependent enzyme